MILRVLETSDVHGHLLSDGDSGLVKQANLIMRLKREATADEQIIAIENGDFIQGSPFSYFLNKEIHHSEILEDALDSVGYDVSILGNHEFNYGKDFLEKSLTYRKTPIICANILGKDNQPYFGEPYKIFKCGKYQVAILGLTTQYIPHWETVDKLDGLKFVSAVTTAKKLLPILKQKADFVFVAYHGGLERDLKTKEPTELLTGENEVAELAEIPGIDALITGHQHRQIADYINGIPLIQPSCFGKMVGEIEFEIENGKIVKSVPKLLSVKNEPAEPILSQRLSKITPEFNAWLNRPVGKVVDNQLEIHNHFKARLTGHPFIELINQVQSEITGIDISATALFNNQQSGFFSTVTIGQIQANYPFSNSLAILQISGLDLKNALEQCASYWCLKDGQIAVNPTYIFPKAKHFDYDIYRGIDYTINVSRPIGKRVIKLNYHGHPIAADEQLKIVLNQYRAIGGGDFKMFSAAKIIKEIPREMPELLIEYLKEHTPIKINKIGSYQVIK